MRLMGLAAIYPRPKTSISSKAHQQYPYLLRGLSIDHPNQVWCIDIGPRNGPSYIRLQAGFVYLTAIMESAVYRRKYSRYVLSWRLSNTLGFCLEALDEALGMNTPDIFNSDQGVQFTSSAFTSRLQSGDSKSPHEVRISIDGVGRCFDNIFSAGTRRYREIMAQREQGRGSALRGSLPEGLPGPT
jgi:putative transposase